MRRSPKLLVVVIVAICVPVGRADAAEFDAEQVMQIWKGRQESVKTLTMKWKLSLWYPTGGFSKSHVNPEVRRDYVMPSKEARFDSNGSLTVDGVKVRYEFESVDWNSKTKDLAQTPELVAFDGRLTRNYRLGNANVGAVEHRNKSFRDAGFAPVLPIFNAIRSFTDGLANFNLFQLKPTGRRAVVNGYDSIEFLANVYGGGGTRHVWLAEAVDWQVTREATKSDNGDEYAIDIMFNKQGGMWMPSSWRSTYFVNKKTTFTWKIEVTQCLINESVPLEYFAPQFPTGIHVYDSTTGKSGQIIEDGRLLTDNQETVRLTGDPPVIRAKLSRFALAMLEIVTMIAILVRLVRLANLRGVFRRPK